MMVASGTTEWGEAELPRGDEPNCLASLRPLQMLAFRINSGARRKTLCEAPTQLRRCQSNRLVVAGKFKVQSVTVDRDSEADRALGQAEDLSQGWLSHVEGAPSDAKQDALAFVKDEGG